MACRMTARVVRVVAGIGPDRSAGLIRAPVSPSSSHRSTFAEYRATRLVRRPGGGARPGRRPSNPRASPNPFRSRPSPSPMPSPGETCAARPRPGPARRWPSASRSSSASASSPPLASTGPRPPRGLVLVPTRELARQVADVLHPLAEKTGLELTACYGGAGMDAQIRALAEGTDLVVATPGRLIDLCQRGDVDLEPDRGGGDRRSRPHGGHGLSCPRSSGCCAR